MRKVIIRDKRKIPPFNEPARDLRVLNKPLWLHQKDVLEPYCESEVEVDFFEQIPNGEYEETLVYRDNLFFDQAFIEPFLSKARSLGKACRVAFSLDDEVITTHALPLQSGIRREGDVYVGNMWYYPRGLEEMTRPLVIDCGAYEFGSYRVPTHMSTEKGDLVFQIPLRAFLSIENWVHIFMANCLFGVLAEGARMERSLSSFSALLKIFWRSLLERKQILSLFTHGQDRAQYPDRSDSRHPGTHDHWRQCLHRRRRSDLELHHWQQCQHPAGQPVADQCGRRPLLPAVSLFAVHEHFDGRYDGGPERLPAVLRRGPRFVHRRRHDLYRF